ncbi:MAG: hypothetical protein OHK93_005365 [Ramalina farinacea]|uniref:Uncharacterized protein n=1 Tax=Ramalina farinacea TaxID=258253 RepID=A0AA43TZJ6_9LECA|nr:hypothetical protein [Ramalina farinacea]
MYGENAHFATDEDLIRGIDETAASVLRVASYRHDPDELEQLKLEIAQAKQEIKENDYSNSSALNGRALAASFMGKNDEMIKQLEEMMASELSSPSSRRSPEELEQLKLEYEQQKLKLLQIRLRHMDWTAFTNALLDRVRSKLPKTIAATQDALELQEEKPSDSPGSPPSKINATPQDALESQKETIGWTRHTPIQRQCRCRDLVRAGRREAIGWTKLTPIANQGAA